MVLVFIHVQKVKSMFLNDHCVSLDHMFLLRIGMCPENMISSVIWHDLVQFSLLSNFLMESLPLLDD